MYVCKYVCVCEYAYVAVYACGHACMYVCMYDQDMGYETNTWLSITYNPKPDLQSDMLH